MHLPQHFPLHTLFQERDEDAAHLAGAADHADIASGSFQGRSQSVAVRAVAAGHHDDSRSGIGMPVDQQLGQVADLGFDGVGEVGGAHELRAIVQKGYAPAERYRQPGQRLGHIARTGNQ